MKIMKVFLALLILLNMEGCLTFRKHSPAREMFKIDLSTLEPEYFSDFIVKLWETIDSSKNMDEKKTGLLYIARACTHHRNPDPDYEKALYFYLEYMKLWNDRTSDDDILDWIKILNHVKKQRIEMEEIKKEIILSNKKNKILFEDIRKKDVAIKELEAKIRKLDSLYFQIEQKKKKKNNHTQ